MDARIAPLSGPDLRFEEDPKISVFLSLEPGNFIRFSGEAGSF